MYSPSKPQISAKAYSDTINMPELSLDSQQVCQCLGRMAMATVTRIDNRHIRNLRRNERGAFDRMTHGNDVSKIAYNTDSVFHCFPF